jgi:hypothetical protein
MPAAERAFDPVSVGFLYDSGAVRAAAGEFPASGMR